MQREGVMMGPILVFGHRNPDNDSVCSAVAYAHLKNITDPDDVYVPVRLGELPRESEWVLAHFGVEPPEYIEHVHARVRDAMTPDPVTIAAEETMLAAGRLMRERGVRALPVVSGGVVRGLVNVNILAEQYIDEVEIRGFRQMPVNVGRLASVLEGTVLAGDESARLSGDVLIGAMEPATLRGYLKPGDTLVVGDRVRTQPMAIEAGVACLIVTGGFSPSESVLAHARDHGCSVISTAHDTFAAARLVNLSNVVGDVMATNVLLVEPDALLAEAVEDLLASVHREAVVIDGSGAPVGVITRTNIARGIRRRVIVVDHNETAQSAPGIEDAAVVEIVDHHRIGDIQTSGPILFLNMPVGATATIVALRYEELGVDIPLAMAGLLLAAVLTDTVLLKSPTATDTDRAVVERLARIAGVDAMSFGMEVIKARALGETFSAERAVRGDLKEYRIGDARVAIAQTETVDLAEVMSSTEEIRSAMSALRDAKDYDAVVLMVTDVVREGSEIIAVGRTRLVERGLAIDLSSGSAWMPGVLSRKKQVASPLVEAAGP